jgi:hypothetical protein
MIRYAAKLIAIAILCASCKQQEDSTQVKMILDGMRSANEVIQQTNASLEGYLKIIKNDPEFAPQMMTWAPRVKRIEELSDDVVRHIDAINGKLTEGISPNQIFWSEKAGHILFLQLYYLKYNLINLVNSEEVKNAIYEELPLLPFFRQISDKIPGESYEQKWIDSSFNNCTPLMCQVVLCKIKNDVLISAQKLLQYCQRNLSRPAQCEMFLPVVSLSNSNVKAGETMIISAGFGKFIFPMHSSIMINGKTIQTDEPIVHYPIKAASKPGKYSIDVGFEHTLYDGTRSKVFKRFSYIVVQ